jgi:hypothetical protein
MNGSALHFFGTSEFMQTLFSIQPQTWHEEMVIVLYAQAVIILLYFCFAQMIILFELLSNTVMLSAGLPIVLNFILLVLVKADFWFSNSGLRYFLPHRNFSVGNVFNKSIKNYKLVDLALPLIYWLIVSFLLWNVARQKSLRNDYIFTLNNAGKEE